MSSKTHISNKTKKILIGTGITFGTILAFLVSFFLAFSLIVNPIAFGSFGNDEVMEENEELKEQVKTLEDEVELLNTTVDKYKHSASAPAPVDPAPEATTPAQTTNPSQSQNAETEQPEMSETPETDSGDVTESDFTPETVTTPEGGIEPEVEPDITVIDITE